MKIIKIYLYYYIYKKAFFGYNFICINIRKKQLNWIIFQELYTPTKSRKEMTMPTETGVQALLGPSSTGWSPSTMCTTPSPGTTTPTTSTPSAATPTKQIQSRELFVILFLIRRKYEKLLHYYLIYYLHILYCIKL